MYVFRKTKHVTTLIEMTVTEFKAAIQADISTKLDPDKRVVHESTTPEQARRWVKRGGHHETGLWVDDTGKVRYARADPDG